VNLLAHVASRMGSRANAALMRLCRSAVMARS
jgi:hypothetical protein